jgi:hypothetical protein
MKHLTLALLVATNALSPLALGAAHNPTLGALMQTLSKDLKEIAEPTKAADPASVKDSLILAAILRAKTNAFLLQHAADRRGVVEKGALVMDELTPVGLDALPIADLEKKLDLYGSYLLKAKGLVAETELLLNAELKKAAADRDFAALKKKLADVSVVMREAHGIFKPASP